ITSQYYRGSKNAKSSRSNESKAFSHFRIKALSHSTLDTVYSLHVKNYSSENTSLSPRIVVAITTGLEVLNNKEFVIATATFRTQKEAKTWDPESKIKFIRTKNGLREIERTNIEPSSIWYQSIKTISERSISKFIKLK